MGGHPCLDRQGERCALTLERQAKAEARRGGRCAGAARRKSAEQLTFRRRRSIWHLLPPRCWPPLLASPCCAGSPLDPDPAAANVMESSDAMANRKELPLPVRGVGGWCLPCLPCLPYLLGPRTCDQNGRAARRVTLLRLQLRCTRASRGGPHDMIAHRSKRGAPRREGTSLRELPSCRAVRLFTNQSRQEGEGTQLRASVSCGSLVVAKWTRRLEFHLYWSKTLNDYLSLFYR